jgi:hypothetical protein
MRGALRRPRAFWISACNIVGLLCSLVGVVLLFWFALPNAVPGGPQSLGVRGPVPGWETENRRYDRLAHIGLVLVIVGTLMEAVPPLCTAIGSARRRPSASRQRDPMKVGERLKIWWRDNPRLRIDPTASYQTIPPREYLDLPSRRDRFWAAMRGLKGTSGAFLAGVAATLAAMAIGKWLGLT